MVEDGGAAPPPGPGPGDASASEGAPGAAPAPGAPVLQLVGAWRRYGPRVALHALDLELAAGEGLAVVGPNGAGKSTLLALAAGALRASGGQVRVLGQDPASVHRVRAAIGYLGPETVLEEDAALGAQVELFAADRGGGGPDLGALREALELDDAWERPVAALSTGFRRRGELAAAAAGGPRLVVLDEPLAGVEVGLRTELLPRLAGLLPGACWLIATHAAGEVRSVCGAGLALEAGRRVDGDPEPAR